jgi:hypothetical protein
MSNPVQSGTRIAPISDRWGSLLPNLAGIAFLVGVVGGFLFH